MNDMSATRDAMSASLKGPSDTQPSLRTWLEELEAAGELKSIDTKVDWDEEIGAIARVNLSLGGPALLVRQHQGLRGRAAAPGS